MPQFDLAMITSGSRKEGLGHLMRSVAIAQEAIDLGLEVGFYLKGDDDAQDVATRELPGLKIKTWRPEAWGSGPSARWLVFDTRHPIEDCILLSDCLTLVIDNFDSVDLADLTIIPSFHNEPVTHPSVLQGAQYCVLAGCVRDAQAADPSTARDLVVSLGGADPLYSSEKIVVDLFEALKSLPGPDEARVRFVIGPAFGKRPILEDLLQGRGWEIERSPSRGEFAALFSQARLAVLGFGAAVYEAAYLGVPAVYITHQKSDDPCAKRLEALELGRFGTSGLSYDPVALRGALTASLGDPDWLRRRSEMSREMLGYGQGARRILEELGFTSASRKDDNTPESSVDDSARDSNNPLSSHGSGDQNAK